jgi:hypothetical protein
MSRRIEESGYLCGGPSTRQRALRSSTHLVLAWRLPSSIVAWGTLRGFAFLARNPKDQARIQEREDAHYLSNAYCIGLEFDGGDSPLAEAQL